MNDINLNDLTLIAVTMDCDNSFTVYGRGEEFYLYGFISDDDDEEIELLTQLSLANLIRFLDYKITYHEAIAKSICNWYVFGDIAEIMGDVKPNEKDIDHRTYCSEALGKLRDYLNEYTEYDYIFETLSAETRIETLEGKHREYIESTNIKTKQIMKLLGIDKDIVL